jgi:bifunctional non-homologous end joining protein LigD
MLATPGELPPSGEDRVWAYEMKWDGVRAVGYLDGAGGLRLVSRNDRDISHSYPEVTDAVQALGDRVGPAIVDGELVTFDERGRTSFERLQERMHVRDTAAARRLAEEHPVVYLVFDVLHEVADGESRSLLDRPYDERRERLDRLAAAGLDGPSGSACRVPPALAGAGQDVLAASREAGMEGIVAKRRDSRYLPGRRSPAWRKVKNFRTQEVIVAGWRPGTGRRAGGIGSLILAVNSSEGLRYSGGVGTGFTEHMLADLARRLTPIERGTPPFDYDLPRDQTRNAHWVEPELVGEVTYAEWTTDGRLRHPSWRGLRPDKTPADVVREELHEMQHEDGS